MDKDKIKIDDNDLFEKLSVVGDEVDKELGDLINRITEYQK